MIAELNVGPRLHPGRRLRDPGPAAGRRCPAPASSSTRRPAATASRRIFARPERGGEVPLAADRGRRRRARRRLRAGRSTATSSTGDDNPYRLLQHKTDPVTLTLNSQADHRRRAQGRPTSPITSEAALLYLDWVDGQPREGRRADRRPGRLPAHPRHGRATASTSSSSGSTRRSARRAWSSTCAPTAAATSRSGSSSGSTRSCWGPASGMASDEPAHLPRRPSSTATWCACINETSASDGDIFPARFRKAGLGPLIGKRSWGGVVGITNRGPLIDGGHGLRAAFGHQRRRRRAGSSRATASTPTSRSRTTRPSVIAGRDPQLERGVAEVLTAIEKRADEAPDAARRTR